MRYYAEARLALALASSITLLLSGCATASSSPEAQREVVLQYLDASVGTAGPFSRQAKKELDFLSPKDRTDVLALLDRGAVLFLVFEPPKPGTNGKSTATASASRAILVSQGKVVGDFRAPK